MKLSLLKKMHMALIAICCFMFCNGQDINREQERYAAMQAEEVKIAQFIEEHINDDIPEHLFDLNRQLQEKHGDQHDHETELSPEEEKLAQLGVKRIYLRSLYFRKNPQAQLLFQPMALGNCINGDLELGNYSGFGAASGTFSINECDLTTIAFVSETPGTVETGGSSNPGLNCEIVTAGPDPLVAALNRVNNGNNAIRVNQSNNGFGINQITYPVVLTQSNEEIAFWYALVLQNPSGHNNRQPFFRASAIDGGGSVQDFFCDVSDATDPFFNVITGGTTIVWSNWTCRTLEVSGNPGDTITLQITTSDCGAGAHWGYSYIDDICSNCDSIDSCNYQGNINLDPTDSCMALPGQVCGTYQLSAFNCQQAVVDSIYLTVLQNGIPVVGVTSPILATLDTVNNTFCFDIDASNFPSTTGGYDFQATIIFDLGASGSNTETDINTNPGVNNDINLDCCPDFDVLDCCTYWSSSSSQLLTTSIDPKITTIINEYKQSLATKYKFKNPSTIACDPCSFPTDSFPVFITDENGLLIDDTYYQISWSHNPGWTAAYSYILPNEISIVTIKDTITGCTFVDTFQYVCCSDVEINLFCVGCDPCLNPGTPFLMNVLDSSGNPLSNTGYNFLWSTGSNASAISGYVNTVYWVEVTNLANGCVARDTFELECCKCEIDADFSYTVNKCTVSFNDTINTGSCTSPDTWSWDFGDGTTSNSPNPTHVYSGDSTYTVCLIVSATDTLGVVCSDTICKTVSITDCDSCVCGVDAILDLVVDADDPCTVHFADRSTANKCTNITGWSWDFGDGTSSSAQNPSHTYSANGIYTICLIVTGTDASGNQCTDTICKNIQIEGCKCSCDVMVDFNYEINADDPCRVDFRQLAQFNECTEITKFIWDFGDGTSSNLADPSHTYASNGSYNVCLIVIAVGPDGKECSDTICYKIDIKGCKDCPCEVSSNWAYFIDADDPCKVYFNEAVLTNECTSVIDYTWDFGDGSISNQPNPIHVYPGDGTYYVCFNVRGTNGTDICEDTFCRPITIQGCRGGVVTPSKSKAGNSFGATVFPNPFNDKVTISFNNIKEQQVEINLLDVSGKQLETISKTTYSQGLNSVIFDAENKDLSEGVYFISIKSNEEITYKKVVLRK